MAQAVERLAPAEANAVRVRRIFEATREEIFDAFTDPEIIVQWWGPPGNVTKWAEVDPRPGGAFRIHMSSEDGSYDGAVAGTYLEVVRPSRLVFEMTEHCGGAPEIFVASELDPTVVTIELKELGNKCTELSLTHTGFPDATVADAHRMGWAGALDKLPVATGSG